VLGSWRTGTAASPLAEFNLELTSFDGPFDLLINLIDKQGFDITTVSLVAVTSQYISYVETLQRRSVYAEATAEFLGIASQLLLLKSQALLPSQSHDEDEDLNQALWLADRLRVYSAYRKLASALDELQDSNMPLFPRAAVATDITPEIPSNWEDVGKLVIALDAMFGTPDTNAISTTVPVARFSLNERIDSLRETLHEVRESTFESLTSECTTRLEILCTFLAVLYLVAQRTVSVNQQRTFGQITISMATEQA